MLTNLVNTREIWVLPNINPDGGEYDIATGIISIGVRTAGPTLAAASVWT